MARPSTPGIRGHSTTERPDAIRDCATFPSSQAPLCAPHRGACDDGGAPPRTPHGGAGNDGASRFRSRRRPARHDRRRVAHVGGRPRRDPLRAARPDRRRQLRRPHGRLDLPHRQPGPGPRLQPAVHAARRRRRAVHDGGQPAGRGGPRRGHRRAPLDVPPRRGGAGGTVRAAALRPRRRLLDGRGRRRAHLPRDDRLPARRARRGHRASGPRVRGRRHRRPQAQQRPGARSDHGRARLERCAGRRRRRRDRRRREPARRHAAEPPQREGLRARLRRAHRRAPLESSTPFPSRASSATRPGRTAPGSTPATPASGRR